jgi:hypothetical protein
VKTYSLPLFVLLFFFYGGCLGRPVLEEPTEPVVPDVGEGWLSFDLQPDAQRGNTMRFHAKYEAEGKIARFDFELTDAASSGDPPVAFTSGRLLAVPGSDSSVLPRNLQKTLEAKGLPSKSQRVPELPFTAAILGTHQSHSADGGFFTRPRGNWTAMKIFIGNKDDPAEVFLNFNPTLRKGEFSIKDADYGDDVLRELAKVL